MFCTDTAFDNDIGDSRFVGCLCNRSNFMKCRTIARATILLVALGLARQAVAADVAGYSGVNLNIRSGPSVRFPAVGVSAAGSELIIHGCLARYTWCDVSASGVRGWASGPHIQFIYETRRVYVPAYASHVEIPTVTFNLVSYWEDYYHDRDFYAELDHWSHYHWEDDAPPPGWRDNWDDDHEDNEY
jgi:uncharacterized protein YraI